MIRQAGFLMLAVCFSIGCATSRVTGFRDPAYPTTRFHSVSVFAHGMELEAAVEVEKETCRKLSPAQCIPGTSILPPIRSYSAEEVAQYLERSGIDALLIAALVSDESDTWYLGTITTSSATASSTTTGTVNFYGNAAFWSSSTAGFASGQIVSRPVYGYSRIAFGQLGLFERKTGNLVWRGQVRVGGQGLLNTTDSAFIKSATSEIAAELKAAGLL